MYKQAKTKYVQYVIAFRASFIFKCHDARLMQTTYVTDVRARDDKFLLCFDTFSYLIFIHFTTVEYIILSKSH